MRERKTKPQTDRKTLFINTQRHKPSITYRQESKRETKTHQAQPQHNQKQITQYKNTKTKHAKRAKLRKNEQRSKTDKKPREKFNQRHKTTKIKK